jgi:hypothetical protein
VDVQSLAALSNSATGAVAPVTAPAKASSAGGIDQFWIALGAEPSDPLE